MPPFYLWLRLVLSDRDVLREVFSWKFTDCCFVTYMASAKFISDSCHIHASSSDNLLSSTCSSQYAKWDLENMADLICSCSLLLLHTEFSVLFKMSLTLMRLAIC